MVGCMLNNEAIQQIYDLITSQLAICDNEIVDENDLQCRPCAIFEKVNNNWAITHQSKEKCGREQYILDIFNMTDVDPKKPILFFFDDYTKDITNSNKLSLCFAKLSHQKSITIPNLHWLMGFIDYCFDQVRKNDISFEDKQNLSIFAGGPNCDYEGARCKYAFSNLDRSKHHVYISNNDICRLPIATQLKYKYQINIDGYGLCYDRLYWQMYSNSVPIYVNKNDDIIQIPDCFIKPNINYIESSVVDIDDTYNYLQNTTGGRRHCLDIIQNNKVFISQHFTDRPQLAAMEILNHIFHIIAQR